MARHGVNAWSKLGLQQKGGRMPPPTTTPWKPCNPCECTCSRRSDHPFNRAGCIGMRPARTACTPAASGTATIPNTVHQIWLGGGELKWEYLLSMLAIRFILRPERFILHYDTQPSESPQWTCACSLAECKRTIAPRRVFGKKLSRVQHQSDVLRLDILAEHGGVYLDHDAFVLKPEALHRLRGCAAPLIAGHQMEQVRTNATVERRMNNGVMLAAPNATMLHLWRESYRGYRGGSWDFNSCELPLLLHEADPALAHLTPDLAPLPRDPRAHDAHFGAAPIIHITGLLSKWWNRVLNRCAVVSRLLRLVLRGIDASGEALTGQQAQCVERVKTAMARWK